MGCSKKQRGVMKKVMKKDGKGGPIGDAVKGIAKKASDVVTKVGDTKIKDAVKGIGNALTRGQGEKKGLLKQMVKGETQDNRITNDLINRGKLPESQRENRPQMPKLPTTMPIPGKGETRPLKPSLPKLPIKMPPMKDPRPVRPPVKPRPPIGGPKKPKLPPYKKPMPPMPPRKKKPAPKPGETMRGYTKYA